MPELAFKGLATAQSGGSEVSPSQTTAAVAAGDLLILAAQTGSGSTAAETPSLTATGGHSWTLLSSGTGGGAVWVAVAGTPSGSVTVAGRLGYTQVAALLTYSVPDAAEPIRSSGADTLYNSATSAAPPALSGVLPKDLVVNIYCRHSNGSPATWGGPGGGWTSRVDSVFSSHGVHVYDKVGATDRPTMTNQWPAGWRVVSVAISSGTDRGGFFF